MLKDLIFIGNKKKPSFLIELNKKNKKIIIYKPDKYSLKLNSFFEKYALGEIVVEADYKNLIFIKNDCQFFLSNDIILLSEIIINIKDKFLWIKYEICESIK